MVFLKVKHSFKSIKRFYRRSYTAFVSIQSRQWYVSISLQCIYYETAFLTSLYHKSLYSFSSAHFFFQSQTNAEKGMTPNISTWTVLHIEHEIRNQDTKLLFWVTFSPWLYRLKQLFGADLGKKTIPIYFHLSSCHLTSDLLSYQASVIKYYIKHVKQDTRMSNYIKSCQSRDDYYYSFLNITGSCG